MAGVGIAENSTSGLQQEFSRIKAIAHGAFPGVISTAYDGKAIGSLKQRITSADEALKKTPMEGGAAAMLAYAYAAHRDAEYATRGRKYMRVACLANRAQSVAGRMIGIVSATMYKDVK